MIGCGLVVGAMCALLQAKLLVVVLLFAPPLVLVPCRTFPSHRSWVAHAPESHAAPSRLRSSALIPSKTRASAPEARADTRCEHRRSSSCSRSEERRAGK